MSLYRVHYLVFALLAAMFLAAFSAGCSPRGSAGRIAPTAPAGADRYASDTLQTAAQRADPGYIQHLEKQSMLSGATEAARIVSGSQLAWQNPASPPSPDLLLHIAPSWLTVNPISLLTDPRQPAFSTLSNPVFGRVLDSAAISGLYVAPTGGSGRLWAYDRQSGFEGTDVVQFGFSEMAGTEEDYRRLLFASNNANRLLGLDAVPAATGMGPDFFLAARNTRSYPGMYCMVEIPREYWNLLPAVENQWLGSALDEGAVRAFASRGLLPLSIVGDRLSFPLREGRMGGWAATAEIRGMDGAARRWVYRYHGSPEYPVLNWEDPSRNARRVLAASAIQSVGLQGAALVGLSMEGLYGLEAGDPNGSGRPGLFLEPGLSAARDMGRELRRYGGWSLLHDELPLAAIKDLMDDGPDLIHDSITSPAAEHALLTGDATLLRFMLDEILRQGIDGRRLAHAMPAENGISYALPHLADLETRMSGTGAGEEARALRAATLDQAKRKVDAAVYDSPKGRDVPPIEGHTLYTTSAGLAALALGAGNAESVSPEMIPHIRQGQLLLAFFKAMQPGLFLLAGQDLTGSLPVSWRDMRDSAGAWDVSLASRGGYSFLESASSFLVTTGGLPRAKTIYEAADTQTMDQASFVTRLGRILGLRQQLGVARGEMHGRFMVSGKGTVAFAVLLPADGPAPTVPSGANLLAADTAGSEGGVFRLDNTPGADPDKKLQLARDAAGGRMRLFANSGTGFARGNSALIVICNFSRNTITETLDLTATPTLANLLRQGKLTVVSSDGAMKEFGGRSSVQVTLDPWQGMALLIGRDN